MAAGESFVFLAQFVVLLLEVLIVATKALYLLLVLGALLLLRWSSALPMPPRF